MKKVVTSATWFTTKGLQIENFNPSDFVFLVELQNTSGRHEDFAKRFGSKYTTMYNIITNHVALRVSRRFLGYDLQVQESQNGRVL